MLADTEVCYYDLRLVAIENDRSCVLWDRQFADRCVDIELERLPGARRRRCMNRDVKGSICVWVPELAGRNGCIVRVRGAVRYSVGHSEVLGDPSE